MGYAWDTSVKLVKGKGPHTGGSGEVGDLQASLLSPSGCGTRRPRIYADQPFQHTGSMSTGSADVDKTLDAEVQPLGTQEVNDMYKTCRTRYGDDPNPDCEPTIS